MIFFTFKVIVAALIIAFSSWLSGIYPKLAGFIIALPIVSLIAILFSYYEYKDIDKTVTFTKSILIAVPLSYLFFVPFFFSKSLGMNFYLMYGSGILLLVIGYLMHKYVVSFIQYFSTQQLNISNLNRSLYNLFLRHLNIVQLGI